MEDAKGSEQNDMQWREYEEVKRKFDEFKTFRRIMNKPYHLIVNIEDIIENIKKTPVAEKHDEMDIYHLSQSFCYNF